MKNIWIIDHYSSEPCHGGISRQYDFAKELSRQGYNVLVIASSFSHFHHRYLHEAPLTISQIAPSAYYAYVRTAAYENNAGIGRVKSMFSLVRAVTKCRNELVKRFGKPDVVEGCSIHPLAWVAGWRTARKYGARFCAEVRDFWPEMWLLNKEKSSWDPMVLFFACLEKLAYRKAHRVIYSMQHGDLYLVDKLGLPREKIALIGQPMDCDRFDENAATKQGLVPKEIRDFMQGQFTCVFAGYYMAYEGVYVMLEAAKMLKELDLPVRFVFVGSGQEEQGMRRRIEEENLDNVVVHGRISKEAIPALLRQADICLAHLSMNESGQSFKYGASKNKIIEYLYANACVVYGFEDANDFVATSGGGIVIKPYDAKAFADTIARLYALPEEERNKFGENGIQFIRENHRVQVLTKKLLESFSDSAP